MRYALRIVVLLAVFGSVPLCSAEDRFVVISDGANGVSGPGPTIFPTTFPTNTSPSESALVHQRAPLSDDVRAYAAGGNRFALDLYHRLAVATSSDENMLASPYSISTALGMTYAGARGRTAEQMAATLRFSLPDQRLHAAAGDLMRDLDATREGYTMSIANRLFAQEGFELQQPFVETTRGHYAAPVEELDFIRDTENSRTYINEWVAEKTNERIRDLLPEGSISCDTRLVLTNAIHFDGKWKYEFDEAATHTAPFDNGQGGTSSVEMMTQTQTFRYGEFDGYQMLEMPYAGDDLSMVVMLPDAVDGLPALEASLTAETLDANLAAMHNRQVETFLPKFKFDASFGLAGTLQDMGMTDAFQTQANFSGIADAPLAISDVLHKAFIDVNEAGTEAAAATAVGIITTSLPLSPPVFRANHPFMFALRDTHSGSLLFLGRVAQPGESTIGEASHAAVPEPASVLLLSGGVLACLIRRQRGNERGILNR